MLWLVLLAGGAFSAEFPLRTNPNTDVVYLEDERMDLALRNKLVAEAKHSVEVVTMLQSTDPSGLAFLQALRTAQKRGVKVKSIYEKTWSVFDDGNLRNESAALLTDSSMPNPGRVICGNLIPKVRAGFSVGDSVHEKMIIIDRGTPDEKIIMSARPFAKFAQRTLDSGIVIRPIDPAKPYLGTDMAAHFDRLWEVLGKSIGEEKSRPLTARVAKKAAELTPPILEKESDKQRFEQLVRLVETPPKEGEPLSPIQFRPRAVQMTTNDLFSRLVEMQPGTSIERRRHLPNENLSKLEELFGGAAHVNFTTYAMALPKELQKAILSMLQEGGTMHFVTNGKKAHEWLGLRGSAYYLTLEDIFHLGAMAGGRALDGLRISFLDHEQAESNPDTQGRHVYLHRKLIVFDMKDGRQLVVLGSDNFTRSACRKCSEMMLIFDDPRMAAFMNGLTGHEVDTFFHTLTEEEMRHQYDARPWFYSLCGRKIAELLY